MMMHPQRQGKIRLLYSCPVLSRSSALRSLVVHFRHVKTAYKSPTTATLPDSEIGHAFGKDTSTKGGIEGNSDDVHIYLESTSPRKDSEQQTLILLLYILLQLRYVM